MRICSRFLFSGNAGVSSERLSNETSGRLCLPPNISSPNSVPVIMDKKQKLASDLEQGGAALAILEPLSGGVLSTVGGVLGKALQAAERRKQTWWKHVVENKTDEEFERMLEYELGEEHGDVILEGCALLCQQSTMLPWRRLVA
jgi:hypothetical protein